MGTSTFTGPIRAGNILNTSGITPGVDVGNVGQVVMAQVAAIAETATALFTTISIPAYSQILSIEIRSTVSFSTPLSIGNTYDGTTVNDATYFTNTTPVAAGITTYSTSTSGQDDNWINSGYPDSQIVVSGGTPGGGGLGVLTITYLQGPNGNT